MAFVPRSTAPRGTALSTYWTSFTGECVWYSIGRIREVAGTPITSPNRAWPVTLPSIQQAKQIYPNADEANGWIKDGYRPSLGAIACWTGVDGHCMNVEAIIDDVVYMSGYNFPKHHSFSYLSYTISEIVNGIPGLGTFQGFVRNPYVSPTPPTQKSPRLTISPQTGSIDVNGLDVDILIEYIDDNDGVLPVNINPSTGLYIERLTDWKIQYYSEGGFDYKKASVKYRLTATNLTPSPATLRVYRTYSTGSVDKTGRYIIDFPTFNIKPILAKWLQKKRKKRFTIIRRI